MLRDDYLENKIASFLAMTMMCVFFKTTVYFERARWPICGIGLPKEVLKKIYFENIIKIIPSLGSVNNFTLK